MRKQVDGVWMEVQKLTEHFSTHEFRVIWPYNVPMEQRWPCLLSDKYPELASFMAQVCEEIRTACGNSPLVITDCVRPDWLGVETTATDSMHRPEHLKDRIVAIDFYVVGRSHEWVKLRVEGLIRMGLIPEGGLAAYRDHVHYDTRGVRARW